MSARAERAEEEEDAKHEYWKWCFKMQEMEPELTAYYEKEEPRCSLERTHKW